MLTLAGRLTAALRLRNTDLPAETYKAIQERITQWAFALPLDLLRIRRNVRFSELIIESFHLR